jgi:hypothetical protein
MHNKEVLELLEECLYGDKYFIWSDRCIEEMKTLFLKHKGQEKELFRRLAKSSNNITKYKDEVHLAIPKENEILRHLRIGNSQQVYSFHVQGSRFNLRILGTFYKNNVYMLTAFEEKQGKRRTDYSGNTNELESVFKEMQDYE